MVSQFSRKEGPGSEHAPRKLPKCAVILNHFTVLSPTALMPLIGLMASAMDSAPLVPELRIHIAVMMFDNLYIALDPLALGPGNPLSCLIEHMSGEGQVSTAQLQSNSIYCQAQSACQKQKSKLYESSQWFSDVLCSIPGRFPNAEKVVFVQIWQQKSECYLDMQLRCFNLN